MILSIFGLLISFGLAQSKIELPQSVRDQQKWAELQANSKVDTRLQGEIYLRHRKYNQKTFSATTPALNLEWERTREEGDWKTTTVLGGRYFKIDNHEFEPNVYLGVLYQNWSIKTGFQVLSWGQSFGAFSADLVNPKDLRDPLNTDPIWRNIPTFLLNLEYFFDGGGVQAFFNPLPRNNKYSSSDKESDFLKSQNSPIKFAEADPFNKNTTSTEFEYGAKINRIFKSGIELSFFGLHHWNRNAVYLRTLESGIPKLKPQKFQLQSYGLGFSKDLNDFKEGLVLRGDYVAKLNDQRSDPTGSFLIKGTRFEYITGLDWSSDDGWTLGAQAINYVTDYKSESLGSLRAVRKLWDDKIEISAFYFVGLNSIEQWFQPKLSWIPKSWIEISVSADFVDADSQDPWNTLSPVKFEDRTQGELKILF